MSKEIYISSTPHETRLAIVENDALTEMYYERENEYTLAGSIYNGKVTRVLPGMQSSFVDIGLDRDAFLYITDFMEEAGDTADFEANANGGDHRRAPRGDRGGDRGSDRASSDRASSDRAGVDRGPRPERSLPLPPAEPTDSELFTEAVAGLDPIRNSAGTGDRGGDRNRRGGRNRRDRNVNSDGTPRRDRAPLAPQVETPAPVAPILESHPDGEVGEGAPGADGSRRWRGRRGRRGNRGERENAGRQPRRRRVRRRRPGPIENAYEEPFAAGSYQPENAEVELIEVERIDRFEFDTPAPLAAPVEDFRNAQPGQGGRGGRENRGGRGSRRSRAQTAGTARAARFRAEHEPLSGRGLCRSCSLRGGDPLRGGSGDRRTGRAGDSSGRVAAQVSSGEREAGSRDDGSRCHTRAGAGVRRAGLGRRPGAARRDDSSA